MKAGREHCGNQAETGIPCRKVEIATANDFLVLKRDSQSIHIMSIEILRLRFKSSSKSKLFLPLDHSTEL